MGQYLFRFFLWCPYKGSLTVLETEKIAEYLFFLARITLIIRYVHQIHYLLALTGYTDLSHYLIQSCQCI